MKMTFKFKIAVIILFCVLVGCTNTSPVSIEEMSGVLRSTVEKMPEEKRIPILAYLDRARPIADDGILYLVEGDKGKFYDLMVDQYKEKYSQENLKITIAKLEDSFGQITDYEYRNQGFECPKNQEPLEDFSNTQTKVVYFVNTNKSKQDTALFFEVILKEEESGFHIVRVNYVSYLL